MRDSNLKIRDIKAFRSLTYLLGALGLQSCNSTPNYGLSLHDAKDLVEQTFYYIPTSNSPLEQIQYVNEYHEIKRTRQLMSTLNKLGLKTPDAGLQICRRFVTRMRN